MAIQAVRMIDTIGQDLGRIAGYSYWQARPVLSYTTRSYAATHAQRRQFKHFIGIDQAPSNALFDGARIKDVEPGAASNENVAALARAGLKFVAYTFGANYAAMRNAVNATGRGANVRYFVAAWSACESCALRFMAAHPDVVAVQWAAPPFGGGILVPGTGRTVRDLNVDLSVGRLHFWMPGHPAPPAHPAKGTWRASYAHDPKYGVWQVKPEPGEGVEMASQTQLDYAVVGINLHTGRHHIKGIDRATGARLL